MNKRAGICYIVIFMILCLVPFAGMIFFSSNTTTENKTLATFPEFVEEGSVNLNFCDELSDYFEDHFAFRQALVNTDAEIQSNVFGVSNVDTVIVGSDGWLYYSDTLDDYLGQDLMSERSIYNAAHNLLLMQEYVEECGAEFTVAIAPNKNSLYGENMPYYYSKKASDEKNVYNLMKEMENQGVNYVDLFTAFGNENEILYLKRDSHWNGKGAVLAYNEILNSLYIEHDFLDTVNVLRTKTEVGDLGSMIYPVTAEPEWNYFYQYDADYSYVTDTESVEDAWIETENEEGEASLLMLRDSFGNTLLPLMANTFEKGYFSKTVPYSLEAYMDECEPDVVISEKAERSIDEYAGEAPLMQGVETNISADVENVNEDSKGNATSCMVEESENDISYWLVSGTIDEDTAQQRTDIYIRLSDEKGTTKTFEAFLVTTDASDYGYALYLSKDFITENFSGSEEKITVDVITEDDGNAVCVYTEDMNFAVSTDEE